VSHKKKKKSQGKKKKPQDLIIRRKEMTRKMNKSEGELNKKEKDPTKEKEITRKTRIKVVRLSAQTVSSCGIIEDFGFLEIVAQTHPFKDMWRVS
jgi:hypothetical protein